MFRRTYLTLVGAITLLLLTIAPVYAAPSLSLGSATLYNFTGKLQATQSCTANPTRFAYQTCSGVSSVSEYSVTIVDQYNCKGLGINDPFLALECRYIPANVTVTQGGTVIWFNGGNVTHTVTANVTANVGLPSFDSGILPPDSSFQYTFTQTGFYHYYDSGFTFMQGTILVTPAPPPPSPPSPTSIQVDLSGTLGWNVEGLSTTQANLNVSHQISVSVSPFPGLSLTPVTETGSFEQSINLSTRVESPGTATSIVRSIFASFLPAISGLTLARGASGPAFQTMLSGQSNDPAYTQWWVNGPLSIGSPVLILHGWSSVTGSENLNLGGNIGTRSAWIVTSQLSQTFNLNIPNPSNPLNSATSTAAANLKLLWNYDKSADLLLRNDNAASLTMHSVTPTTIDTVTGPVPVTVTQDMAVTVDLALRLSSTSLSLPRSPSRASTLMGLLSAMPWMPLGIAGIVAGIAATLIVWFTRRAKRAPLPGSAPVSTPVASPTTPS